MSAYYCADVKKFHDKFELVTPPSFRFLSQELFDFRLKFFYEEGQELQDAYVAKDLGEVIDALIDMVYITCGCALLHGIDPGKFEQITQVHTNEDIIPLGEVEHAEDKPGLLPTEAQKTLVLMLKKNIELYQDSVSNSDVIGVGNALAGLYTNSLFASAEMNFTTEQWDELWDDVQRANMSKVRALKAGDSKRGSTYDVVKPKGWVPPRTAQLIEKFMKGRT